MKTWSSLEMLTVDAVQPVHMEPVAAERDFSSGTASKVHGKEIVSSTLEVERGVGVVGQDAVKVQFVKHSGAEDVGSSSEKSEEKQSTETGHELFNISASLEKALNDVSGKEIKFSVSLREPGENDFRFQVVEKESGEVVREFPPDEAAKKVKDLMTSDPRGVLLDHSA